MKKKIAFLILALVFCINPIWADYTTKDLAAWLNRKGGYIESEKYGKLVLSIRLSEANFSMIFFFEDYIIGESKICGLRLIGDMNVYIKDEDILFVKKVLENDKILPPGLDVRPQVVYGSTCCDIGKTW